jgi:hypothetical protein
LLAPGSAGHVHHRADPIAIAAMAAEPDGQVVIAGGRDVAEDGGALADAADHDIDPSVTIEIAEGRAAMPGSSLKIISRKVADIDEAASARVCQYAVGLAGAALRESLHVVVDGSARGEQVFVAIVVEVEDSGAPAGEGEGSAASPAGIGDVREERLARVSEDRKGLTFIGGHKEVFATIVVQIARVGAHRADSASVVVERHPCGGASLTERAIAFVVKEEVGDGIVGDEHIEAAILVEIQETHTHAFADVGRDSRGSRDVRESAVAIVPVEAVRQSLVILGMAMGSRFTDGAGRLGIGRPLAVVHDEEIETAIVIVIEPAGRDGPRLTLAGCRVAARARSDIFEGSVAAIAIENVAIDAGDEEIFPSIVVVVRDSNAGGETRAAYAGGQRDVGEGGVAIIPVEAVEPRGVGLIERRLTRAVHEIEIGVAVVVVIEDGHTGHHGFDLMTFGRRGIAQDEVDPGARCDIFEENRIRPGGGGEVCQEAARASTSAETGKPAH